MRYVKLLKAAKEWYDTEDYREIEPYDKRVELENKIKEQIKKLNDLFSKLDAKEYSLHYEKEEWLVDKLKTLEASLDIVNSVIEKSLSNKIERNWNYAICKTS